MVFEPTQRTVLIRDPALRQFDGGFTSLPNRVLKHRDLSLGARMTYGMLLSYAWQKDFCHPAQDRLAVDLGVSDRSVRTFLAELRDRRLVTWKRQGLNKPNIYYLLRLPDAQAHDHTGPEDFAGPDRKLASVQERQSASDEEYSLKNTKHVNVASHTSGRAPLTDDERAHEDYLASEILAVCGDTQSMGFYRRVARLAPPDVIYGILSNIKSLDRAGRSQTSRGAAFTDLIKRHAKTLDINLELR